MYSVPQEEERKNLGISQKTILLMLVPKSRRVKDVRSQE